MRRSRGGGIRIAEDHPLSPLMETRWRRARSRVARAPGRRTRKGRRRGRTSEVSWARGVCVSVCEGGPHAAHAYKITVQYIRPRPADSTS